MGFFIPNRNFSMEHKIQLDVLGIFSHRHQEATFTLLLEEIVGYRKLPIVIGLSEAQSIALAIESKQLDRPVIHDFCREAITKLGYTVKEVVITALKDNVFFSQIVITDGTSTLAFDAKPADAIAIGLRFKAPLYTEDALLNEVGALVLGIADLSDTAAKPPMPPGHAQRLPDSAANLQQLSVETLQQLLSAAVASEDYEQAALIRDELKRRE